MLTLMAVHAHPDDEATSTGGILAKYGAEGVRTVLVTCTNGELGDAPGGAKPGDPGHDEDAVVASRRRELEESCRVLGIQHLEMLGFHDSGMMGWDKYNQANDAFWTIPVETAAAPLARLIERYQPDVVVTYDDFGFYGHPDHIQAHRITVAALASLESRARLFFPTVRRSRMPAFRERMVAAGVELPDLDPNFGSPDEKIVASIDVRDYAPVKMAAVRAHGSQSENLFFLRMSEADFAEMFGREEFLRGDAGQPIEGLESDLFAGLRPAVAP